VATKLLGLKARVANLEKLADEVHTLAERFCKGDQVQPELANKGQQWYRGARELMTQHSYSGLKEFDNCYEAYSQRPNGVRLRHHTDIQLYLALQQPSESNAERFQMFARNMGAARALLLALSEELESRELPVLSQLSFALSEDEFEKAFQLLNESNGDETLTRASGVVARIALERYLHTLVDSRQVTIIVNPPTKKKPDAEDLLNTLVKASIIDAVQRSHVASLLAVGNNCAHPKEAVRPVDVERLIKDARTFCASVQ